MNEDVEAEASEDSVLELGVLVHDDGHDAHVGQEPAGTTHDVFSAKNQPNYDPRVNILNQRLEQSRCFSRLIKLVT